MAVHKREELWWDYPLKDVPAAEDKDIQKVKSILRNYINEDLID